jgi:hypothetical protein
MQYSMIRAFLESRFFTHIVYSVHVIICQVNKQNKFLSLKKEHMLVPEIGIAFLALVEVFQIVSTGRKGHVGVI